MCKLAMLSKQPNSIVHFKTRLRSRLDRTVVQILRENRHQAEILSAKVKRKRDKLSKLERKIEKARARLTDKTSLQDLTWMEWREIKNHSKLVRKKQLLVAASRYYEDRLICLDQVHGSI